MAIIYSKRNDNTGSHTTVDANTGSTWVGESAPLPADQVYVVGRRTTINQAAFAKWTGTRTITVASTSNFASAGFFYTVTNGGEIVKVNYTGTTSTTFTGCSLDESDIFYKWDSGQTIPNGAYVHNPAYVVEVGVGETFECNELIIQEGGWFFINGGTLKVNQGIILRDGRLVGRGAGTIIISRGSGTAASSTIGYLNTENYQLSVLDIDGEENRTYATLAQQANKGDGSIVVSNVTNGSFQVGDEIAVYEFNSYRFRNKGYVANYRDVTSNLRDIDEGLDVVGVSGNTLYVGMRNGARGQVKSVNTDGSKKVLQIKPENVYFTAGDKVVIDNNVYTIDTVEDDEFTLYDYDFTNPNTSLSDFWVNDSTHVYSGQWEIESGVGLRCTSGAYREFVHKYFWDREYVIEAEMSPLSGYATGARGSAGFGLLSAYDPAFRWGHRGYDGFKTDYLIVDDANADVYYYIRAMTNYNNNVPSRNTPFLNAIRAPATYRVDTRKSRTLVTINGEEFTTEFRRDGAFKGLVGLFCSGNTNMRCRRLVIKSPVQKVTVTTENNIPNGSTVYRTSIDHTHPVGSRVVKIASINTGTGNHKDLAFGYRGQNGSGIFPIVTQLDGTSTVNNTMPYVLNHNMNQDYLISLTDGTNPRSVTIDLTTQQTFTHVSFVPQTQIGGTYFKINGVAIYGSNDMTNWTTLYGPTNDTKYWERYSYNVMGYYPTGTVSYRYIKFETRGTDYSPYYNRFVNIGVHNFQDGYKIAVNNASDFNVGDKISVMTDGAYSFGIRETRGYYMAVTLGLSDIENSLHGGWLPECTITSKDGNTLYLDRPIWWGYVEDADSVTVFKTNKNFTITGTIGTTFDEWRFPNITIGDGAGTARLFLLKNTRLDYIGSARYSGSTNGNRGIVSLSDDPWNHVMMDGCVFMMGPDTFLYNGFYFLNNNAIIRNSVIMSMVEVTFNAAIAYMAYGFINNKVQFSNLNVRFIGIHRGLVVNYNELSGADTNLYMDFAIRTDYLIAPNLPEIRFNSMKGTSSQAMAIPIQSISASRGSRVRIENNKVRGMDDWVAVSRSPAFPFVDMNAFSEHTGSRLSRYTNQGFISYNDVTNSTAISNIFKNFGRFGYDLGLNIHYIHEKDYSKPNIIRTYCLNNDTFFAAYGIELDVIEDDVPFKVVVQFDYRIPLMANLQDDGNMDGALRVYSLHNGSVVTDTYTPTPSNLGTGWNTYTQTFEFLGSQGRAGVFLNRDARNGYFEMKNMSATVYCDNLDSISIVANTFDVNNFWDQNKEKRGIKKYTTTNPTTINMRRIRF